MREIKFRGKRLDNGEWVEGSYFYCNDKRFDIETVTHYIIGFDKYIDIMNNVEINIETLGQFTGLYDKNGKEIYEGDIVEIDKNIYSIKYDYGCFLVDNSQPCNGLYHYVGDIEVIGNIYDNPELLKELKDEN